MGTITEWNESANPWKVFVGRLNEEFEASGDEKTQREMKKEVPSLFKIAFQALPVEDRGQIQGQSYAEFVLSNFTMPHKGISSFATELMPLAAHYFQRQFGNLTTPTDLNERAKAFIKKCLEDGVKLKVNLTLSRKNPRTQEVELIAKERPARLKKEAIVEHQEALSSHPTDIEEVQINSAAAVSSAEPTPEDAAAAEKERDRLRVKYEKLVSKLSQTELDNLKRSYDKSSSIIGYIKMNQNILDMNVIRYIIAVGGDLKETDHKGKTIEETAKAFAPKHYRQIAIELGLNPIVSFFKSIFN